MPEKVTLPLEDGETADLEFGKQYDLDLGSHGDDLRAKAHAGGIDHPVCVSMIAKGGKRIPLRIDTVTGRAAGVAAFSGNIGAEGSIQKVGGMLREIGSWCRLV